MNAEELETVNAALNKAKLKLMSTPDSAFFTTLCFSLKTRWDEKIPTAATNGKDIRFNPKFFMSLNTEEQVFLLLHETLHVAYLHMTRLNEREPRRWNKAGDYVINLQLVERNFTMPKSGLLDVSFKGMSTEQVYEQITDEDSDDLMLDLEPTGSDGVSLSDEQLTQEVQDMLVRASIQSKMNNDKPGTIPGDVQVFLDKLLNPKLPWNKLLLKYLNAFDKNDYSFKKPNRRFLPQYYLPSLYSHKLMDLAIAVDISGSVSDHDFNVFVSEIAAIFKMMKPEKIKVIQFDTEIHQIDEVKSINELLKIEFRGRGGTLVFPVLEWATENKPQLLMIFSDGEFTKPTEKPKHTEVLWLIHNDPKWEAPFGKAIHYHI